MSEFRALKKSEIDGLTGLQQLQAMLEGRLPQPPMAETLNFRLVAASEGQCEFRSVPSATLLNPLGTVHGGWAATLLDSALGCAVHTTLAAGEGYTTVEFKVNLLRAVLPDTGEVICSGRIINRGRRIALSEAQLKTADGKLLAHGTETCLVFARDE